MDSGTEAFKKEFLVRLENRQGKPWTETTTQERCQALCAVVRDRLAQKWLRARQLSARPRPKQVYYLSIEFLLGRLLEMNLLNLGLREVCAEALRELNINLSDLLSAEEDPGLGNGGLGRLAACYLDAMAAEQMPGHGFCIRYRHGFFEQKIIDGYQVELPDNWLAEGFAWEFRRPEEAITVKFGGDVHLTTNGKLSYTLENYERVLAVPYDVPIPGYNNDTVNTLRLWSAEPARADFVCSIFGPEDCLPAIDYKQAVEKISDVLYPNDSTPDGRLLRLKQHYFLVAASLQNIVRDYQRENRAWDHFPAQVAIHINDTHPALAIPELMRILIDEENLGWDEAWRITVDTMSFTNHTVLPEAMDTWPVDLLQPLLPRIYIIINEINERFCRDLWARYPGDWDRIAAMAIIADGKVHMVRLALVGSHSINGVAKIHTKILKTRMLSNFYQVFPEKFHNVTNGITHRRWLMKANPRLAALISQTIGPRWISDPPELQRLTDHLEDPAFLDSLAAVKRHNKLILAKHLSNYYGLKVDCDSLFDSHIKRIHGYKRQLMNIFHIMYLYNRLRENPALDITPRTFIFSGKAAPGYYLAKLTIKLINTLAAKINNDRRIAGRLKVIFLENYNVSLAELIIPASDVSEQIPTASREACGTGNMKFMMNGAVTIGTMDGANIEIAQAVGEDNIVVFGLTPEEVLAYYQFGGYRVADIYQRDRRLKTVFDQLTNGFLGENPAEFQPLANALLHHDEYFVLKDFGPYVIAQKKIEQYFQNPPQWRRMAAINIAHSGKFTSDQTFREYAAGIWHTAPAPFADQATAKKPAVPQFSDPYHPPHCSPALNNLIN